jgi:hypothetical protein
MAGKAIEYKGIEIDVSRPYIHHCPSVWVNTMAKISVVHK